MRGETFVISASFSISVHVWLTDVLFVCLSVCISCQKLFNFNHNVPEFWERMLELLTNLTCCFSNFLTSYLSYGMENGWTELLLWIQSYKVNNILYFVVVFPLIKCPILYLEKGCSNGKLFSLTKVRAVKTVISPWESPESIRPWRFSFGQPEILTSAQTYKWKGFGWQKIVIYTNIYNIYIIYISYI